jgi:3-oxoacyl-[acyl-carrier protein] reductase
VDVIGGSAQDASRTRGDGPPDPGPAGPFDLSGRTALVTGGSRGIGRAVALALAAAGARVAVNYARSAAAAEELAGDVARRDEAEALVAGVLERWGRLDVLVNNAGITRDGLILRMKDEDWDQVVATDLTGPFYCVRAAARAMLRQRSGRIVNVASVSALGGNAGQANYAAAKAGLIGLTRAVARELAGRGVTVNAVAPGWIETDMTSGMPAAAVEQVRSRIPLGRLGRPEDVAQAVLYLASPAAAYVTGQVLVVDGGLSMAL